MHIVDGANTGDQKHMICQVLISVFVPYANLLHYFTTSKCKGIPLLINVKKNLRHCGKDTLSYFKHSASLNIAIFKIAAVYLFNVGYSNRNYRGGRRKTGEAKWRRALSTSWRN